uniref:NFkB activating protein-like n=1 Tax=Oryza sativa subsp. japonica TaxID=39947 RepID=Q7XIN6_ORYSJ|nr:NFkB activating protein-like [Oryza sativa Japonica Group]
MKNMVFEKKKEKKEKEKCQQSCRSCSHFTCLVAQIAVSTISSLLFSTEIGLGLSGFGVLFSFLGIIMLFDKGFLAIGNILFVSGVSLTIGPKSTVQFFTKPKNHKGSIAFGIGFFLVLIGWPFFGMLAEAYGFVKLFRGFWPTAAVYLQKSPTFGWIFHHPLVTSVRL